MIDVLALLADAAPDVASWTTTGGAVTVSGVLVYAAREMRGFLAKMDKHFEVEETQLTKIGQYVDALIEEKAIESTVAKRVEERVRQLTPAPIDPADVWPQLAERDTGPRRTVR